jgi:hypothetical protein
VLRNAPSLALQARGNDTVSFNNWNNISALQGFDEFNGNNNFDGRSTPQTIVIKEVETKCETVQVSPPFIGEYNALTLPYRLKLSSRNLPFSRNSSNG